VVIDVSFSWDASCPDDRELREVRIASINDLKAAYRTPEILPEVVTPEEEAAEAAEKKKAIKKRRLTTTSTEYAVERLLARQVIDGVDRYVLLPHCFPPRAARAHLLLRGQLHRPLRVARAARARFLLRGCSALSPLLSSSRCLCSLCDA
jgi:hypothetical protein